MVWFRDLKKTRAISVKRFSLSLGINVSWLKKNASCITRKTISLSLGIVSLLKKENTSCISERHNALIISIRQAPLCRQETESLSSLERKQNLISLSILGLQLGSWQKHASEPDSTLMKRSRGFCH